MIGKKKRIRRQLQNKHNKLSPHELASCYGKIRYSKQDRESALLNRPPSVKFYKCQHCPYYHIGKRKEPK